MKYPLAAVAAILSLAFAQSALAANTATISVTHDSMILNGSKSTTIHIAIPQATDPIAAINIFVPAAYTAALTQAPGTTIGSVDATAFSHDAGLTLPLSGNVVTDAPASHTSDSAQCAGTPTSQAVWVLQLSVAGQAINLPLYVNPTVGAQTALGKYRLTICLPPPDVPIGTPGRSAQGAQVLDARFTVNNVFTTPVAQGVYTWESVFTPYNPGKGTVNAAGTFEARALVPLPVVLGLSPSYIAKGNTWRLAGTAFEGGLPVAGLKIHISRGISPTRLTQQSSTTTGTNGGYRTAGHLQPIKTTYFRINASVAERPSASGCANPLPPQVAPAGCVSATLSAWQAQSRVVSVKAKAPAKKKKHK
jgi:hypothetical protein